MIHGILKDTASTAGRDEFASFTVIEKDIFDRFAHRGNAASGTVNGNKEERPHGNERIVWNNAEFAIRRLQGLYAVEQSLSCIRRDSIARDADTAFDAGCRDNSFSREFPAEVMNTVVVAGDLDVRLTVPMAEA